MARGWESKSVESQMEDRPERSNKQPETREAIELKHRRMSLEMSRRQVEHDLQNARSDVHRVALEHALRHLDQELGKLEL